MSFIHSFTPCSSALYGEEKQCEQEEEEEVLHPFTMLQYEIKEALF